MDARAPIPARPSPVRAEARPSPVCVEARPWKQAALALLVLGPFFFASYGFATLVASQRAHVGAVVFGWEHRIPLLPWTIIPYWSIDVLYAVSVLLCPTRAALRTHVLRLVTVQAVAVACFLAFPLRFSVARPALDGVPGALFAVLAGFDKPFNQAPSLHIALLVVLWVFYGRQCPARWRWALHGWFALIGVSVLTTWQHHFVDVPTGALLGFLNLWLWPESGPAPLADLRLMGCPRRRRMAWRYALGAAMAAGIAVAIGGTALWLLWPGVSLAMVALAYAAVGPALFQKGAEGRLSLASTALLAPYLIAARVNTRLWPGDGRPHALVCDGVSVGRMPATTAGFDAVVDLCAELAGPTRRDAEYTVLPMLDLVPPPAARLRDAAHAVERARRHGTVLVCCALGYSRSAAVVATWLLTTGRANDAEAAVARVARARPRLVLDAAARSSIALAGTLA